MCAALRPHDLTERVTAYIFGLSDRRKGGLSRGYVTLRSEWIFITVHPWWVYRSSARIKTSNFLWVYPRLKHIMLGTRTSQLLYLGFQDNMPGSTCSQGRISTHWAKIPIR